MKKIELLSPAGNMQSLKAAIAAGCDAVYLGGDLFGARAFANNFSDKELIEAIKYAHLYGVKIYVTTNILILENEVDKFLQYIEFLHRNNVDAIIIQDLGMLDLVHKTFPNLEIHASTQMHIHNLDGVIVAKKLGVKRVVLARETPIELVRNIIDKTKVDIEIFAHGALCVSYSGQCLFSSLIGNRSGNRGTCVGSCRLKYNIEDEHGNKLNDGDYPLSMKDLNTLEYVGTLIDCGITSLKIEGRMKSPEYVYTVTKLYREAIDSYYKEGKVLINKILLNNLQKIFSRGYTKGYLFNENMEKIINPKRPNHQGLKIGKVVSYKNNFIGIKLYDEVMINDGLRILLKNGDYGFILNEFYINKKLVKKGLRNDTIYLKVNKCIPLNSEVLLTKSAKIVKEIENIIEKNIRKVKISFKVIAKLNKPLQLIVSDGINESTAFGNNVVMAKNIKISNDDIKEKITKLGNTIYEVDSIVLEVDNNIFIPLSELNNLKRVVIEKLSNKRLYQIPFKKEKYYINIPDFPKERKTAILTENKNIIDNYDIVYSNNYGIKYLTNVRNDYFNLNKENEYLVGELGAFNELTNINCDYSFNVTNSYTVALLHSLGAKRITLSLELTFKQVENIVNSYNKRYNKHPNLEVIIGGYRNFMTLKTNLNKIYNCEKLYLVDRFNNHYLIKSENDLSRIYELQKFCDNFNYYDIGINVVRKNDFI